MIVGSGVGIGFAPVQKGDSSTFFITLIGLTGGEARPGNHAAISYTTDATGETVKWSNSSNSADPATYGTGASPTDYTAGVGGALWLHVTADGETVSRSVPIRYGDWATNADWADNGDWAA